MPDRNRTSASASAAIEETSASKPTKTRWLVLVLISFMYLITYMDRSNISVAAPGITKEFGLSKTAMGWVFSAFTLAYALGQFPGGWLGDRIGPRKVLTVIMFWWAIAAVSTGAAVGFVTLLCARFLLGLGEAGAFPVATRGMQLWFPKVERGRIQGITHCFSRFAVAITPFVAVGIMTALGWRAIFFIFGSLGAVWAAVFGITYLNRPEDHKSVNQAELAHIRGRNSDGSLKQLEMRSKRNISWKLILRSPNMWYIAAAYGCFFYGTYFFLTWYPTYLQEYRHFSIRSLGFVASLPLFAGMIGDLVGGSISDFVYRKTGKLRIARRVVAVPGLVVSGLMLIPTALTHSAWTAVLCLAISFFFLELVIGPAWAVPMDVGGEYSGTVSSVMNTAGALAASISPVVFGFFAQRGFWIAPFFVTAAVLLSGALVWTFLIDPEMSVVGGIEG
ncbi:MAG TPA: MFS transporter [Candidatus Acidoferrales bacterium]|nr:MFS transporter [Candidatus Acidoferrales bacterium]